LGPRATIVIVGAGFCGTVLATRLLSSPAERPLRVVLVERSGQPGRGVAYARRDHDYLLNVPAGRMSADPRAPDEFLEYARRTDPSVTADEFLPRALYGDYLEERLRLAQRRVPPHIRFECLHASVRAVRRWRREAPLRVELDDGNALVADAVVLAVGNSQPARLPQVAAIEQHPGYVADPWRVPAAFANERVLLIGTGLTMVDIVTAAFDRGAAPAVVHAVSRHGFVPPRQTAFRADALRVDGRAVLLAATPSIRRLASAVRTLAADASRDGGDWREAVSFVRSVAPAIWQRMPLDERRRFLRHARSYWDVHRHRLPFESLRRIDALRAEAKLHVHAARLRELRPEADGIHVVLGPRGSRDVREIVVDRVVNCTGPDFDLTRLDDPLWKQLREDGLAVPDELGLGLRTARDGAVFDRDGWPGPRLFYLGPMLRAGHWEATAALELRDHAERLATRLVAVGTDDR
jgi:uncharacterized NAD(P)/FAD-binding protein YdhS